MIHTTPAQTCSMMHFTSCSASNDAILRKFNRQWLDTPEGADWHTGVNVGHSITDILQADAGNKTETHSKSGNKRRYDDLYDSPLRGSLDRALTILVCHVLVVAICWCESLELSVCVQTHRGDDTCRPAQTD